MALLARLAVVVGTLALAACYDPDLRDCTVTCKLASDCAGDQTCGPAGLCVGPGATSCSASEQPDAAVAATVVLHVTVDGKGSVVVDAKPAMTCVAAGNHGDCTYAIAAQTAHHLVAAPQAGRSFMTWAGACTGSATTCAITPSDATTVGATFQH